MQLLSLGQDDQFSLFSQPGLEVLKKPSGAVSLWDMGCVSTYLPLRLWELPASSRTNGDREISPRLPWVL